MFFFTEGFYSYLFKNIHVRLQLVFINAQISIQPSMIKSEKPQYFMFLFRRSHAHAPVGYLDKYKNGQRKPSAIFIVALLLCKFYSMELIL